MNCARNCENLLNFVKVTPKTLLVPFFPDKVYIIILCTYAVKYVELKFGGIVRPVHETHDLGKSLKLYLTDAVCHCKCEILSLSPYILTVYYMSCTCYVRYELAASS